MRLKQGFMIGFEEAFYVDQLLVFGFCCHEFKKRKMTDWLWDNQANERTKRQADRETGRQLNRQIYGQVAVCLIVCLLVGCWWLLMMVVVQVVDTLCCYYACYCYCCIAAVAYLVAAVAVAMAVAVTACLLCSVTFEWWKVTRPCFVSLCSPLMYCDEQQTLAMMTMAWSNRATGVCMSERLCIYMRVLSIAAAIVAPSSF